MRTKRTEPPESDYSYAVTSPAGVPMMRTAYERYRYDAQTELSMLDAGYTIRINGKRLTKKTVQERMGKLPPKAKRT